MSTRDDKGNGSDGSDEAYLWDGSGQPSPDLVALEQVLAPHAHRAPLDVARLGAAPPTAVLIEQARQKRWVSVRLVAAAAMAAAVVALILAKKPSPPVGNGLPFVAQGSSAKLGSKLVGAGQLGPGQQLQTTDGTARVSLPKIGELTLAPQSSLRLVHLRDDEQRLSLARGRIDASVIAPPRLFVVETPRATVVDLGCAYTIVVDDAGVGHISVSSGLVEIVEAGRTLVVIRGFASELGTGNGLPVRVGAHPDFTTAAKALTAGAAAGAESPLERATTLATRDDAPTLAHLLPIAGPSHRPMLARAIVDRVGPPTNTSLDAVVSGDPAAIAQWISAITNNQLRRQEGGKAPGKFHGKSPGKYPGSK